MCPQIRQKPLQQNSSRPVPRQEQQMQLKRRKGAGSRGAAGLSITHFFTSEGTAAVDF